MAAATAVICRVGLEVTYLGHAFVVDTEPYDGPIESALYIRDDEGRRIMVWLSDLTAADGSPVL